MTGALVTVRFATLLVTKLYPSLILRAYGPAFVSCALVMLSVLLVVPE